MTPQNRILVLNSGSSSVKYALFSAEGEPLHRLWPGALERIGVPPSRFYGKDEAGTVLFDERKAIPNHQSALDRLLRRLEERGNKLPRSKLRGISKEFIPIAASCGESDPHRIEVTDCWLQRSLKFGFQFMHGGVEDAR